MMSHSRHLSWYQRAFVLLVLLSLCFSECHEEPLFVTPVVQFETFVGTETGVLVEALASAGSAEAGWFVGGLQLC